METLQSVLLLAAIATTIGNWIWAVISFWNKWHGIDRGASLVPAMSAILVSLAWLIGPRDGRNWIFIIPAVDIGCWVVLWLPFWLMLGGAKQNAAITSADQSDAPPAGSGDFDAEKDISS